MREEIKELFQTSKRHDMEQNSRLDGKMRRKGGPHEIGSSKAILTYSMACFFRAWQYEDLLSQIYYTECEH